MDNHRREFFVSRIRTGAYNLKVKGLYLTVVMPTIRQEFQFNNFFSETYDELLVYGIQTEDEITDWMKEKELWTEEDEKKIEGLQKDIERLRVEIYNNRTNTTLREQIRAYIRAGERQLIKQLHKKKAYYSYTCEGMANLERAFFFIKSCTYLNNIKYDFKDIQPDEVLSLYNDCLISDADIRELARTDPWRSIWSLRNCKSYKLFANKNREPSVDQKNILIWSRLYDNIQESLECPTEDVINDDDLLDGWFIIQKDKRDKDKTNSDFDNSTKSDKIKNSGEVFMMSKNKKDASKINNMNDMSGKVIKSQREALIKKRGDVDQGEFGDEKMKMMNQSNNMYKDKFRR